MKQTLYTILILLLFASNFTFAKDTPQKDTATSSNWTTHFQLTAIEQFHGNHHFPYSGPSSLDSNSERPVSLTSTLFLGRRLWKNVSIFFNHELIAGNGFSGSKGFAGFPNGEIYRVGNPIPTPFIARLYFQQVFALGGTTYEHQPENKTKISR